MQFMLGKSGKSYLLGGLVLFLEIIQSIIFKRDEVILVKALLDLGDDCLLMTKSNKMFFLKSIKPLF